MKLLRKDACNLCGEITELYFFSATEAPGLHKDHEGVSCLGCAQDYLKVEDYEVDTRSDWEDW